MLKYCVFDAELLRVISSSQSADGHAHAICPRCDRAYRFTSEIPLSDYSHLIIIEDKDMVI